MKHIEKRVLHHTPENLFHLVSDVNVKPVSDYAPEDAALLCSVGRLICAWTMLEQSLEAKVGLMREGMGDVRTVGARTRPSMSKLMTELRTMVAMRDRRNASALMEISAIERDMQRISRGERSRADVVRVRL